MAGQRPRPETLEGKTPAEQLTIINRTANLPAPSAWKLSEQGIASLSMFRAMNRTEHGMYAAVPIICKGVDCPYAHVCPALERGIAPMGDQCTKEMAMILEGVEAYCRELGIDDTSRVQLSLVKELVDCEVMIARCDSLIAKDGGIIEDVTVGITEHGQRITRPEIKRAVDAKEKWMKMRQTLLNQLNSTPKDKAKTESVNAMDPSKYAAMLVAKARENNIEIIDMDAHQEVSSDEAEANIR